MIQTMPPPVLPQCLLQHI